MEGTKSSEFGCSGTNISSRQHRKYFWEMERAERTRSKNVKERNPSLCCTRKQPGCCFSRHISKKIHYALSSRKGDLMDARPPRVILSRRLFSRSSVPWLIAGIILLIGMVGLFEVSPLLTHALTSTPAFKPSPTVGS